MGLAAAVLGLAAAFFGAALESFLGAAAFFGAADLVVLFYTSRVSKCFVGADHARDYRTLGAALGAAGLGSFFAIFTGPEGPLGWVKSPDSTPAFRVRLKSESKALGEVTLILLLARTYFLIAWRLLPLRSLSCGPERTRQSGVITRAKHQAITECSRSASSAGRARPARKITIIAIWFDLR